MSDEVTAATAASVVASADDGSAENLEEGGATTTSSEPNKKSRRPKVLALLVPVGAAFLASGLAAGLIVRNNHKAAAVNKPAGAIGGVESSTAMAVAGVGTGSNDSGGVAAGAATLKTGSNDGTLFFDLWSEDERDGEDEIDLTPAIAPITPAAGDYPRLELVGDGKCSSAEGGVCGNCQGDCDTDDDCAEGLTCFVRDSRTPSADDPVPGCDHGPREYLAKDFCVDANIWTCGDVEPFTNAYGRERYCSWAAPWPSLCDKYSSYCRETCGYCRPGAGRGFVFSAAAVRSDYSRDD